MQDPGSIRSTSPLATKRSMIRCTRENRPASKISCDGSPKSVFSRVVFHSNLLLLIERLEQCEGEMNESRTAVAAVMSASVRASAHFPSVNSSADSQPHLRHHELIQLTTNEGRINRLLVGFGLDRGGPWLLRSRDARHTPASPRTRRVKTRS